MIDVNLVNDCVAGKWLCEGKVTRSIRFAFFQWTVVLPSLVKSGMLLGYSVVLRRHWSICNSVWSIVSAEFLGQIKKNLECWVHPGPASLLQHTASNLILLWVSLGFVDQLSPVYPLWHPSSQKTMKQYERGVKLHFQFSFSRAH